MVIALSFDSQLRLIVGLGNPGKVYEHTRHNLGFLVVRELAKRGKTDFQKRSLTHGVSAHIEWEGTKAILLQPMTYMNNSGLAVKEIVGQKEIDLERILVICDDFNLDFGQLRMRRQGSDGGHNGLESVIGKLESNRFARLRMGISQPKDKHEIVKYVLAEFTKEEQAQLDDFIQRASECCLVWLKSGIAKSMDNFNKKR